MVQTKAIGLVVKKKCAISLSSSGIFASLNMKTGSQIEHINIIPCWALILAGGTGSMWWDKAHGELCVKHDNLLPWFYHLLLQSGEVQERPLSGQKLGQQKPSG